MEPLNEFENLNKKFIERKISVKEYDETFFKLKNKYKLSHLMSGEDSYVISEIEDWIQGYESDSKIREKYSDYIDEEELREGIKKIQKILIKRLNEK